jgi:hypothetical protein
MITTKAAAKMETYGRGGTYNRGRKYDETQCVHGVWSGYQHHQCTRKPGHGPDELYCKQHDPVAKAAKYKAEREADTRRWAASTARKQRVDDIADAKDDCVSALRRLHPDHPALITLDNAINREV